MNASRIASAGMLVLMAASVLQAQPRAFCGGNCLAAGNPGTISGQPLSQIERDALTGMIEEEKLAHDVYVTLAESTALPLYTNIAGAESRHVNALRQVALRYSVDVPSASNMIGEFSDPKFKELYVSLVKKGKNSPLDAAEVGAKIEELDISDLTTAIANSTHDDITAVYSNLQRASRNHLRSYSSQISSLGGTYDAEDLSQKEFDRIATSAFEPGGRGAAVRGQRGTQFCGVGPQAGTGRGNGVGRAGPGNCVANANAIGQGQGRGAGNAMARGQGVGRGQGRRAGNGMGRGRGAGNGRQ